MGPLEIAWFAGSAGAFGILLFAWRLRGRRRERAPVPRARAPAASPAPRAAPAPRAGPPPLRLRMRGGEVEPAGVARVEPCGLRIELRALRDGAEVPVTDADLAAWRLGADDAIERVLGALRERPRPE